MLCLKYKGMRVIIMPGFRHIQIRVKINLMLSFQKAHGTFILTGLTKGVVRRHL